MHAQRREERILLIPEIMFFGEFLYLIGDFVIIFIAVIGKKVVCHMIIKVPKDIAEKLVIFL